MTRSKISNIIQSVYIRVSRISWCDDPESVVWFRQKVRFGAILILAGVSIISAKFTLKFWSTLTFNFCKFSTKFQLNLEFVIWAKIKIQPKLLHQIIQSKLMVRKMWNFAKKCGHTKTVKKWQKVWKKCGCSILDTLLDW